MKKKGIIAIALTSFISLNGTFQIEAQVSKETMESISTPDKVETRYGTLEFFDGFPTEKTVEKAYDYLDFSRGVEAFMTTIPAASMYAIHQGLKEAGAVDGTIGLFETLMDSKSLFLTANTESMYGWTWLDLKNGPVVVESPPNVLGFACDSWFRNVADLGHTGPDKGEGGKFLFIPPGYEGDIPDGYYTIKTSTYGNYIMWRGFGTLAEAIKNFHSNARIYPLTDAENQTKGSFVNLSGKEVNTIHANNFHFYEEVNAIIQHEPSEAISPEILGILASIGIEKGKPFAPDERMKKILEEAAAFANATARSISFATRDKEAYYYTDRYWKTGFIGGNHEFKNSSSFNLDARTLFHYLATGITPAMSMKMVGAGSQYAYTERSGDGNYLDGGENYVLHMPPNIPVNNFWSIIIYDPQTRSMLQTDNPFPSVSSLTGKMKPNKDGSYDVYFGPTAPKGKENNWIQTVPNKGWFPILRLYGPLDPWFDKTWKPGEIEPVK